MRSFYALLLLALGLSYPARAQQPFLKYGVRVKVATLSNGRFQEFFTNDSLRRIGSVVYDTRLHRVAYLLPPDSLVGHAKPDVTSRWISPDPLAEKDNFISPYAFARDNAIRYNDPDGREVWVGLNGSNDVRVRYHNGKLYNENGSIYKGTDKFALKVRNDLNQIRRDNKELMRRVDVLDRSKNIHDVVQSPDEGNHNHPLSQAKDEKGIPTGTTTEYNPNKDTDVNGNKRDPKVGLAHEMLGHGYDSDQGKTDYKKTSNGIPMYEVNAVKTENKERAATGDPQKTTYGGQPIPPALLQDPQPKP